MRCEILTDPEMFKRGARMLQAMIEAAPIPIEVRERYVGDCEILMVYGTGHPIRRAWQLQHLSNGGRMIGWDLGYWDRAEGAMRATLDADHPWPYIRPEPPDRWNAAGIPLREDWSEQGEVVVAGMGPKSNRAHGLRPLEWERVAIAEARAAYGQRRIIYKPKKMSYPRPAGVLLTAADIASALRGASLLVCRHSNVAVDACIAGVPVVCEDGAARALYDVRPIAAPFHPTTEQRRRFLESLAWWQWRPEEAAAAWTYLLDRIRNG